MSGNSDNPGQARSDAALVLAGVSCMRGERVLFTGFDLAASAGTVVWLRGANGRGKTTLLRTVAGLAAPAAGSIARHGPAAAAAPLYLAHANALKDDLSAGESLRFLLRLGGVDASNADIDTALARFGMASRRDAPVRTLSQGQRRRVALARLAAARGAGLWLLDEPYDALDADAGSALDAVLAEHARRGGVVVLTSHVPLALADPAPVVVQLGAAA